MFKLSQYVHIKKQKIVSGGATLYQNKKSKSLKFILARRAHYIPFLIFSLFTTLLGSSLVINSQYNTFAAPGAPTTSPIITISNPASIDFSFTQAELASSTFKHRSFIIDVYTNNSTGATGYISSIDEDTNLSHSDSSVTQKIASITTSLADTSFSSKNWGYRASRFMTTGNYLPIPKASAPDILFTRNSDFNLKHFLNIGVKSGPDLPAGRYSKQIVFTVISNYVPNDSASKTILWWSDADTVYANEDARQMFSDINNGVKDVQLIDITGINTSKTKNMSRMFHTGSKLVKKINITDLDTSSAEDMSYMFASDKDITHPINVDPIDFSHINTSRVKNMEGIFYGSRLSTIDVRHFDTSRVTNLFFFFAFFKSITDLNVSGWQNDSATNMAAMFGGLTNLNNFQHAGFTTKNVQNMRSMFWRCRALANLDLREFDTSNVIDMSSMFSEMTNLASLDVSSFRTHNVVEMSYMFTHWPVGAVLQNLDLSNFDTSNVKYMTGMFMGQANLINLNISSFDTRKVTSMREMFLFSMRNPGNGTLDISSFDTRSLTDAIGMFRGSGVKTILVSPSFTVAGLNPALQEMFANISNLVGGNGTSYVLPNYASDFAHIDAPGNPGYFTQK